MRPQRHSRSIPTLPGQTLTTHKYRRMLRFLMIVFWLWSCIAVQALAQVTLRGLVREAGGEPLSGATVLIDGGSKGITTDLNGQFELTINHELPFTLWIRYLGYIEKQLLVSTPIGFLEIELEKSTQLIDQVTVTASRHPEKVTSAPAALSIVDSRRLQAEVVSHPILSLRNLPGVEIQEHSIGRYQVGLRSRRTTIEGGETFVLVDNRQLVTPGLTFVSFSASPVDPIDLDRIEVVRGPGSALYGPGVEGGVIHFITKNPFDAPGTSLSLSGGSQSSLGLSIRQAGVVGKKLGYKILGIYNRATNWPLDKSDSTDAATLAMFKDTIRSSLTGKIHDIYPDDQKMRRFNLTAQLDYRLNNNKSLTAAGGYSQVTARSLILFYGQETRTPHVFGQVKYQSPRFFSQIYATQIRNKETGFTYDRGLTDYLLNTNLEAQAQYRNHTLARERLNLVAGTDYRVTFVDTKGLFSGRNEKKDNYSIWGAYAQAKWSFTPELQTLAAARVDYFAAVH